MPSYTFYIYSTDILAYNSGTGAFDFGAGYDSSVHRYRIDVTDDDADMDASGDASQLATVYDMDGNVVDSGPIISPFFAELNGGDNQLERIEVNGTHYGYTPESELTPGTSYPVTASSTGGRSHSYYEENSVPCFGPATLIETPHGRCQISVLRPGDQVVTYDNGPQPVLWAGKRVVTPLQAIGAPELRPIRFTGGLRGVDDPQIPLMLSQNHRVMLDDPMADLLFAHPQVFAASKFLGQPHVPRETYAWHHILLPRHEVIRANGAWVESLFAGAELEKTISATQNEQIDQALDGHPHLQTARHCLNAYEARVLLERLRNAGTSTRRNKRVA